MKFENFNRDVTILWSAVAGQVLGSGVMAGSGFGGWWNRNRNLGIFSSGRRSGLGLVFFPGSV